MSVLAERREAQDSRPAQEYDVVVLGAGPYGLSVTSHLLKRGLRVAIFGKPLQLWRDNMPTGMLLRSFWWATNLSDPQHQYSLEQYFHLQGQPALYPLPIETFIDYGLWFQRQAVPNVDETYVDRIEREEDHFSLTLADGRLVRSRMMVMAPGLRYYVYRPSEYNRLPAELVSHTSQHGSFQHFAGKRVVVVGGGQSALESAALLHESGARVDVVTRSAIRWLVEEDMDHRSLLRRLRHPNAGIAPGWLNWGLEHMPYAFQQLPRSLKDNLLQGRLRHGPAGSAWLKPRVLGKVTLHERQPAQEIRESDDGVVLKLAQDGRIKADHVLLATGYRVNIWNLPMLSPALVSRIRTYRDAPVLNSHFESSVPGLYFVGISSVSSFGPFYRFVVGTAAAAQRVTDAVVRRHALVR